MNTGIEVFFDEGEIIEAQIRAEECLRQRYVQILYQCTGCDQVSLAYDGIDHAPDCPYTQELATLLQGNDNTG